MPYIIPDANSRFKAALENLEEAKKNLKHEQNKDRTNSNLTKLLHDLQAVIDGTKLFTPS